MKELITITNSAVEKLFAARDSDGLDETYKVRVSVSGGGCSGFRYELQFDNETDEEDSVNELILGDARLGLVYDAFSAMYLENVVLDYVTKDFEEGFKFSGGSSDRRHCACGSSFSG